MEALSVTTSAAASLVWLALSVLQGIGSTARSIKFFPRYYGIAGIVLSTFGSRDVWRVQFQVLHSTDDKHAMDFRNSAQNDCSIIAVAGTILAQIAITAVSLTDLSQAHWVARGFFTFSLVSSFMAVYYATRQYRILGRCLRADQVRAWIRSKARNDVLNKFLPHVRTAPTVVLPSAASVLTISAPNVLLSSSLNAFLVGLGVYLGYVWTSNLDKVAGPEASRAVFITYVVGLGICYGIYTLSGAVVADQNDEDEETLYQAALDTWRTLYASTTVVPGNSNSSTRGAVVTPVQDVSPSGGKARPSAVNNTETTQKNTGSRGSGDRQEILQALHDASLLRKQAVEADERIAQLLERLL